MRLFKKLYDYQKDNLRIEFILEEERYYYFYINQELSDKDLNRRTRKKLKEENAKLQNNPDLLKEKIYNAKVSKRFKFLNSKGYSCTSFEYLGQVNGTMSKEMEIFLTNLTSKEGVLLGIHRVKQQGDVKKVIEDILTNGLILNGHTGSGVGYNDFSRPNLENSISYYPDNKTIIKELMYANEYKASVGAILIEIPDSDLNIENLFYIDDNALLRLNPKYIVGFIPVDEKHHISKIIKKSDFKKNDAKPTNSNYDTILNFYNQMYFNNEDNNDIGGKVL